MVPKVSVLMPVHNSAAYLAEAVESMLGQTLADLELICIDDGSTDESPAILRRYADQDRRVNFIRRERIGLIVALNEGLRLARAPLIARMDADDISYPDRLELQYRRMEPDPDLWVLGTAEERIDAAGRSRGCPPVIKGSADVARQLREKGSVIRHPSVMMRRDLISDIGGYRAAYKYAEDYDLWLRVSERGKLDNLDVVGVQYRMHAESISHRHMARQRISAELARATHRLRRSGQQDPTANLDSEPDLWTDPLLDSLIPAHAKFFRFVDLALMSSSDSIDTGLARKMLKDQESAVVRANRSVWQEALTTLGMAPEKLGLLRLQCLAAAFRVHPGRFIRNFAAFLR